MPISCHIYEVFPLICPNCTGQMRITPARGPPLWDECGAQVAGDGVAAEPPPGRGCVCRSPLRRILGLMWLNFLSLL